MIVPPAALDVPTLAALTVRARGRRRRRGSWGQQAESVYVAALAVLVLGSMAASTGVEFLSGTGCSGPTGVVACVTDQRRIPLAVALASAGWALTWRIAAFLGPVGSSRPEIAWLLSTPADRRTLLVPALGRSALLGLAIGAVTGAAVVVAVDPSPDLATVAAGCVLSMGVGMATVHSVAVLQSRPRRRPIPHWPATAGTVAAVALAAVALTRSADALLRPAAGWVSAPLREAGVVAALLAVLAVAAAVVRVRAVPLWRLRSAGDAQAAAYGAVLALDSTLVSSARGTRRGPMRSRRGRATGWRALAHREAMLLLRRRSILLTAACWLVVPAVVVSLSGSFLAQGVTVLLSLVIARSAARSLRAVRGSRGLARSLPLAQAVVPVLLVTPIVVTLLWAVAVSAVIGQAAWTSLAVAAAAGAGTVRATFTGGDAGTELLVATPAGPIPIGLATRLVRGPDVTVLAAIPLLAGAGPTLAVGVPVAVLAAVVWWAIRHDH